MAKKRSSMKKGLLTNSRLLFWVLAVLIFSFLYIKSNSFSASTNNSAKVAEVFDEVSISPSSYKVQLVDEAGVALKPEVISKISATSQLKGKNCGAKGTLPDHPAGGCYTISKPAEEAVTIASDGTITFQNKLLHVGQTFEYTNKKQKKLDYYFAATPTGSSYIAWNINVLTLRTADKKMVLGSVPITSRVYLQKNLDHAKEYILDFNNNIQKTRLTSEKIISVLGTNAGTITGAPATLTDTLSSEVIASNLYTVQIARNGSLVTGQNYQLSNWYYECTVTAEKKEKNCTKTIKYQGTSGIATDGKVQLKANLLNVGNDYFIGEALGSNRFRIWSKTEVIAVNADGQKIASKTVSSPFYRPKLNLFFFRVMDSTSRSNSKEKMLSKFNNFIQKEYIIKMR